MALVIKYVSQPHAGREIVIPDDQDEVTFGRAADADVGFPIELDIVSRDHFRLRREVGAYKFVISRALPVFSRGRPVLDGEELDAVTEIQLSGPDGPRLRIEQIGEETASLPKTRVVRRGKDIGDFAAETKAGGRRLAAWLGVVAVAAAAVTGGYLLLSRDIGNIKTEIPALAQQAAKTIVAASGRIDMAAIVAAHKESVYQIQLRLPGGAVAGSGTASVVQMPNGTKVLATNAHVAEMFLQARADPGMAGMKVVAVQPKAPDYPEVEITGAVMHPAYQVHRQWVAKMVAMGLAMAGQSIRPVTGYDVGLMFVADPTKLGEPLSYASRDTINAVRSGDPLVLIGYAMEGVRGTDERRPEPTSQTGIITAMTTFYLYRGADEDDHLIQHSVPAAGGASGSPMFNAEGEVVGFLNSGNVADVAKDGARMPSAAMVNYAMRADLLLDMLDGSAADKVAGYRAQMADAEARYAKSPDEYLADITMMFGSQIAGDPKAAELVVDAEIALDQALPETEAGRYGARELVLQPGTAYMVVAMSADGRPITVALLDALQRVVAGGPNFAYVSHAILNNAEARLPKVLWAVIDIASARGSPVSAEPGKVRVRIYRAPVRAR